MACPRLCIAGVDWVTGEHLRPVTTKDDLITRTLLSDEGGPLQLGARIELGGARPTPSPPETEDHLCKTANFRVLDTLSDDDYLELLDTVAVANLSAAFGDALERDGGTYTVEPGTGDASLACVRASAGDRLVLAYGKPRLRTADGAYVSVNDIRFFEADQKTVRSGLHAGINRRLKKGAKAYLMFGLSRPWRRPGGERRRHWLQLNGICLADRPLGKDP